MMSAVVDKVIDDPLQFENIVIQDYQMLLKLLVNANSDIGFKWFYVHSISNHLTAFRDQLQNPWQKYKQLSIQSCNQVFFQLFLLFMSCPKQILYSWPMSYPK